MFAKHLNCKMLLQVLEDLLKECPVVVLTYENTEFLQQAAPIRSHVSHRRSYLIAALAQRVYTVDESRIER